MSAGGATGAVLGLFGGLGLALAVLFSPPFRRPGLDARLAPYVTDDPPSRGSASRPRTGGGPFLDVLGLLGVLGVLGPGPSRWAGRIGSGSPSVRRRLDQLGGHRTVQQVRAEQVVCGLLGGAAGAAVGLGLTAGRGLAPGPVLALLVVGGLLGVLGRDHQLTRQVRRREAQVVAQFPAIAELLALSVGAGEGVQGALDRVARTCSGELADDLRRVLAQVRAGEPLVPALEALAARTALPELARFVDGVVVALDRGTPLADVLRAQAQDVRELSRRRLIESGGRREIAMTVPVVFLVLPVTVVFALFPGLAVLDL